MALASPDRFKRRGAAARRLCGFSREEDGAITILTIFFLLMLLMICGIAVDLMRNEIERVRVQQTLDRAILAAADLQQTLPPEAVVRDYFEKAGIEEYLGDVTVSPGADLPSSFFRTVEASARARTPSPYMSMTGVSDLPLFVSGRAEEVIGHVEISLVLDISGSMNSNSRLANLKVAAQDFVDQVINNSDLGRTSISIVPYAAQVSLPDTLADPLPLDGINPYSNCVNFVAGDFDTTTMRVESDIAGAPPVTPYERTLHFDRYNHSRFRDGRLNDPATLVPRPECRADPEREVLALQQDAELLKQHIRNLTADGNTSIDIGMKWGTALLDPTMRPVVEDMIADNAVPGAFLPRPLNYGDEENLKVVILMTDGRNTTQYRLRDHVRAGPSEVWFQADDEIYSAFDEDRDRYYYSPAPPGGGDRFGNAPYGCDNPANSTDPADWNCAPDAADGGATNLTYPALWAYTPLFDVADTIYDPFQSRDRARNDWVYGARQGTNSGTKNTRTRQICDAAKDAGIVVFTIGFEAPSDGLAVLQNCASSLSHYFDVQGLEIADAFTSIAYEITQLRLTQ